jgi:adenosylhomocysteine nucleosidase
MKIGVIAAMREEFCAVTTCLGTAMAMPLGEFRAQRFSAGGHEFLVVKSGMGLNNAARAAELLIHSERLDLLISTGFCGGIFQDLLIGDVVVAEQLGMVDERGFADVPIHLSGVGKTFVARQAVENKRIVGGTFVCTAVIMSKKRVREILPEQYANPVMEMESGAVALIAAENNIPLLAIRVVSDTATEELGFSLDEFCDSKMRRILPYKVLLTILKNPRLIPHIIRLYRSSRTAAESLSAAFTRLLALL